MAKEDQTAGGGDFLLHQARPPAVSMSTPPPRGVSDGRRLLAKTGEHFQQVEVDWMSALLLISGGLRKVDDLLGADQVDDARKMLRDLLERLNRGIKSGLAG